MVPAGAGRPLRRGPPSGARRRHRPRRRVPPRTRDTVERLLADYQEACAWSRATAAGHALDDVAPHFRMGEVSLRWIYVYMIEETARHAGHADILREQLDGTTGT